jgi:hypothetical protein
VNGCYPPIDGLGTTAEQAATDAGVSLDPDLMTALDEARRFRLTRQELQAQQLQRLSRELPLPQLQVPFLFTASIGPEELDALSDALGAGVRGLPEPAPVAP